MKDRKKPAKSNDNTKRKAEQAPEGFDNFLKLLAQKRTEQPPEGLAQFVESLKLFGKIHTKEDYENGTYVDFKSLQKKGAAKK